MAIALDPSDQPRLFAMILDVGGNRKVSCDGGGSWIRLNSMPQHTRPHSIAIHPGQTNTLFLSMQRGSLYRSHGTRTKWEIIAAGLPPEASIANFVFNSTDSQQMFFTDSMTGFHHAVVGGQTWLTSIKGLRTQAVNSLTFSSDGEHLHTTTEGEGAYRRL